MVRHDINKWWHLRRAKAKRAGERPTMERRCMSRGQTGRCMCGGVPPREWVLRATAYTRPTLGRCFTFVETTSNGRPSGYVSLVLLKLVASRSEDHLTPPFTAPPENNGAPSPSQNTSPSTSFPHCIRRVRQSLIDEHASLNTPRSPLRWLAPLRHQENAGTACVGSHFLASCSSTCCYGW